MTDKKAPFVIQGLDILGKLAEFLHVLEPVLDPLAKEQGLTGMESSLKQDNMEVTLSFKWKVKDPDPAPSRQLDRQCQSRKVHAGFIQKTGDVTWMGEQEFESGTPTKRVMIAYGDWVERKHGQ